MLYTEGDYKLRGQSHVGPFRGFVAKLRSYGRETLKEPDPVLFSSEAQLWLHRNGFMMVNLDGVSLEDLLKRGLAIGQNWQPIVNQISTLKSRHTQVALNIREPFLKLTDGKNHEDQEALLAVYNMVLSHEVPGIQAIAGTVTDYAELIMKLRKDFARTLFGKADNYGFARSSTILPNGSNVIIGSNSDVYGLTINQLDMDKGSTNVHISPILVPSWPNLAASY